MDTNVIIANIIGFIAFTISAIAYHQKTKKNIFADTLISNILKLIHYIILGAYSGIATKVMAIVRDFTMVKQDKYKFLNSKTMLLVFVLIYILLGIFTYQGVLSIFSILAAVVYTIVCWNGNENRVRLALILCEIFWIIYNAYVKSYTGCIYSAIMIISTIIAIYRNKRGR